MVSRGHAAPIRSRVWTASAAVGFPMSSNIVSALNQHARAASLPTVYSRASPRPASASASCERSPICLLTSIAVRKAAAAADE